MRNYLCLLLKISTGCLFTFQAETISESKLFDSHNNTFNMHVITHEWKTMKETSASHTIKMGKLNRFLFLPGPFRSWCYFEVRTFRFYFRKRSKRMSPFLGFYVLLDWNTSKKLWTRSPTIWDLTKKTFVESMSQSNPKLFMMELCILRSNDFSNFYQSNQQMRPQRNIYTSLYLLVQKQFTI